MPLIPYKRLIISTSLSTEKAASVLAGHLVKPQLLRWGFFPTFRGSMDPRKFTGKPYEKGFKIWRNAWSLERESFQSARCPVTYVRLQEGRHGTLVDTVITVPPLLGGILLIILCATASEVCRSFKGLTFAGMIDGGLVVILSFFLILYSILMLSFNYEANLAERFLGAIYHGH